MFSSISEDSDDRRAGCAALEVLGARVGAFTGAAAAVGVERALNDTLDFALS